MSDFLSGYRDPLFGLFIFFSLVFIVSFFSYWWAVYKSGKKEESIESFLKKFESNSDKEFLNLLKDSKEAAFFMADVYTKRGDYEKAISILLQNGKRDVDILKRVAKIYLKAGFLQKSKDIYIEVLGITPRDREALENLIIIYEKLNLFKEALDVAFSLDEILDAKKLIDYLKIKEAVVKKDISFLKNNPSREAFEALFRLSLKDAWEIYDDRFFFDIVDILWSLPKKDISFHTPLLKELYSAKGYIDEAKRSDIFELDLLIHYNRASIDFEYVCKGCKRVFPFYCSRCPECNSIDSMDIKMLITKGESFEEGFFV